MTLAESAETASNARPAGLLDEAENLNHFKVIDDVKKQSKDSYYEDKTRRTDKKIE